MNGDASDDFKGFTADYYSGLMGEAIHAVMHSRDLRQLCDDEDDQGAAWHDQAGEARMLGRYAFMLACVALEAGANALVESSPNVTKALYGDFEKLQTLSKFELFALIRGTPLDRGNDIYGKMVQVVKLRNDFFHPKHRFIDFTDDPIAPFVERNAGSRSYPVALETLTTPHAILLLSDVLAFVSWVVFDTCGFEIRKGASLLGRGSVSMDDTIWRASEELNFDIRSFGCDETDVIRVPWPTDGE